MKVCVHTHVESGSLSLLPRPGILKAFARLFFPPSGAKTVIYSSKPTRAADNRQFDVNKKHPPHKQNRHVGICILSLRILPPPQNWLWVLSYFHGYANSWSCCCFFVISFIASLSLAKSQISSLVSSEHLAGLCLCPSALQISGWGYRCRCFPHSAWIPHGPAAEMSTEWLLGSL